MDLSHQVQKYFDEVRNNEFSRLRAWEFIYAHTRVDDLETLIEPNNIEKTGLHLGLYLAQWGMFRGSGNLIDQNLNYFCWMAEFFFRELPNRFPEFYKKTFDDFGNDEFCTMFDESITFIRNEKLMYEPSDTLISKIMLGIWGHIPALDTQFIAASRRIFNNERKLQVTRCNAAHMKRLLNHSENELWSKVLPNFSFELNGINYEYTMAKKIDMAFWILGATKD